MIAVLLVVSCFLSCSKESEEVLNTTIPEPDFPQNIYEEYGITDYKSIDLLSNYGTNFSGLRDGKLWLASFNKEDKSPILNWTDNKPFDRIRKIYKGYGKYEDVIIQNMRFTELMKEGGDFIARMLYGYTTEDNSVLNTFYGILFKKENSSKEINTMDDYIKPWYEGSIINDNCCYSPEGDTIFIVKEGAFNRFFNSMEMISYEEAIYTEFLGGQMGFWIGRRNFELGEDVWNKGVSGTFNEPHNAKSEVHITDKSANIWSYSIDIVYYDGSKKTVKFKVNIDDGTIEE